MGGSINLPFGQWNFLERWLAPVVEPFSVVGGITTNTKVLLAPLGNGPTGLAGGPPPSTKPGARNRPTNEKSFWDPPA